MKTFHVLILAFLLGTLACGILPTALPTSSPTIPPPLAPSQASTSTEEPPTPEILSDENLTNEPPETLPAPIASPQPAVAHHHSGDPIVLDQITMIDALHGWAISGADVLFTADEAQTWREATPPEVLPPGSQIRAQGVFLDAQHAWIVFSVDNQIPVSAVVWNTADSGQTWTASVPLEHQAYGEQVWAEFFALDAAHLWLIVRGVYVGAGTHYVAQFLHSTDSGLTWLPSNENFDYNNDYTGLVFADANNGLLTWETTGAYAPAPPAYAVTSDGGVNWEARELPPPTDVPNLFDTFDYCEPFQPHMLSSTSIRMLMGCFDAYDPPHAFSSYLYSSEDDGATWKSTRLPEKVLANQAALFFFDRDNALLLTRDIYRSTDGGQTWKYVKSVNWDAQFSFVDPQTGWAIARANAESALVKTSNGGAAWTEVKPVIAP